MMMPLLLALAAAASVPSPSADWTIIAESDSGVMAMDPNSVVTDGALRSVWTRASTVDDDGMASTMVVLAEVDCSNRTWAKRRFIALDENGRATEDHAVDAARQPVVPGTPSQAIFERVCA